MIAKNLPNNTRVIQKNLAKIFVNLNRVFLHETSPLASYRCSKIKGPERQSPNKGVFRGDINKNSKVFRFGEARIFLKE